MKALALVLAGFLTQTPPSDAPVEERPAQTFKAGEIVPFDGVCMSDGKALQTGKRIASCEASLAVAESKTMVSTPVLIAGVVAVVALIAGGVTAGFVAGQSSRR